MRKCSFLACLCLLALTSFSASREDPAITVSVEAKVQVKPDRAYLVVYAKQTDSRAEAAVEKARQRMEKTIEDIQRKQGRKVSYDTLNIGIKRLDGKNEYNYLGMYCVRISCPPDNETIFSIVDDATEYDVNNENEVSIDPIFFGSGGFPAMNSGLPAATHGPYPSYHSPLSAPVIYAVEDYRAAEEKLQSEALSAAKECAEELAKKTGKKTGDVLSIEFGLVKAAGRNLGLPTPYISDNCNGVVMIQSATVSYQLLSTEETP